MQAKQEIQRRRLSGDGQATAAIVIGIIDIALWLIGTILYRVVFVITL